jgi:hypothetical protein
MDLPGLSMSGLGEAELNISRKDVLRNWESVESADGVDSERSKRGVAKKEEEVARKLWEAIWI